MSNDECRKTNGGGPRLSIVVAGRNDDHGGGFLRRFRIFAEGLAALAGKHGLRAELIVVDWNTPDDRPPLMEAVPWRRTLDPLEVRVLRVPPKIHRRIPHADVIPFFQMIAKNAGIHRARGAWVLATNCDLLFSEELIAFLAHGDLRNDAVYRIDRTDVPAEAPDDAPVEEQLRYCAAHRMRVHRDYGSVKLEGRGFREAVASFRGFLISRFHRVIHRLTGDPLLRYHTNACGDFTLMARPAWEALGGYPELPLWSMHLDSVLCINALGLGLRTAVLRRPMALYHLEHANGWAAMTIEEKFAAFERRPWVADGLFVELYNHVRRGGRSVRLSPEGWGLAGETLPDNVWTGKISGRPSAAAVPAKCEAGVGAGFPRPLGERGAEPLPLR